MGQTDILLKGIPGVVYIWDLAGDGGGRAQTIKKSQTLWVWLIPVSSTKVMLKVGRKKKKKERK
jgi:hypothetical protein